MEVRRLDMNLLEQWIELHKTVYGRFPWPRPISKADVVTLIESSQNHPFVACHNRRLMAIAALKVEDNSEVLHLADLAALEASSPVIESLIRHLISKAKDLNAKRIWTWIWDSEKALLDALTCVGFVEKERHGLISLALAKSDSSMSDLTIKIESISDGIKIPDFVQANREAFKDDTSRLLEEKELEEWLAKQEGFLTECQLAAVVDNKIAGTLLSEVFVNSAKDGSPLEAWVYGLGVIEQYRRQGIASVLLNELNNRLITKGVNRLWLFTDTKGPIRAFYEHAGCTKEADWIELDLEIGG